MCIRDRQPFTRDVKALDARLKLLHGEAGTAMYDAVYLGAQRLEPRQGRKVIVVVTNGAERNIGRGHGLEFIASDTGGRCYQPTVGDELDKAFNAIITELRTQYL